MQVGLVAQRGNHRAESLVAELCAALRATDVDVAVDRTTHAEFERGDVWLEADEAPGPVPEGIDVEGLSSCDLVVSVGGDGTFLYAARGAGSTPIMGVNLGEVGFLNAVAPGDALDAVTTEVQRIRETGSPQTREIKRVQARTPEWTLDPALNEVLIQGPQRGHADGVSVEVRVDGSLYTSGTADGVLVATAAGSTAYNLSEGGPLIHPAVGGFVVSEMCGIEPMPPLVVDPDAEITVRLDDARTGIVIADGRVRRDLTPPAEVTLSRAEEPVAIAGPPLDFFTALGKLD